MRDTFADLVYLASYVCAQHIGVLLEEDACNNQLMLECE